MDQNDVKTDLIAIGEALPYGAFTRIAEQCGVTPAYVSQFFAGKHNINEDNEKLLDAAKEELDEQKKKESKAHDIAAELLNKTRE